MAPIYADHPFTLLQTPCFRKGKDAKVALSLLTNLHRPQTSKS